MQLASARRPTTQNLPAEAKPRLYPWARFWAKQLDFAMHAFALTLVLSAAVASLGVEVARELLKTGAGATAYIASAILLYPLTDALLVSTTGGSPGRAMFRFSVRQRNGKRPSFAKAFSRAWTCLFFGQSLGVLTYWASYTSLLEYGASLWDRDAGTEVVHRGPKWWSWLGPMMLLGLEVEAISVWWRAFSAHAPYFSP